VPPLVTLFVAQARPRRTWCVRDGIRGRFPRPPRREARAGHRVSRTPTPAEPVAAGEMPEAATLGSAGPPTRREAARLEILRALERGELDVEAASHRLEILEEAGPGTSGGADVRRSALSRSCASSPRAG
jgi:hypothetical protein